MVAFIGCMAQIKKRWTLPDTHQLPQGQLVVHSDFEMPVHHRLMEELRGRRTDISQDLLLPVSDEPIHIYLFESAERFEGFMRLRYPSFPQRRAFFVESDTRLEVYAQWGDRVGDDLRHEVTHGYLHSVVPNVPLWLDEGLAEYYELPRASQGMNREHLDYLCRQLADSAWRPDLIRLEKLGPDANLSQADYAESWAWTHYLLNGPAERKELLRSYLRKTREVGFASPLSEQLASDGRLDELLIGYIWNLVEQIAPGSVNR
jgi:Protein of unknown function (DUF1570)